MDRKGGMWRNKNGTILTSYLPGSQSTLKWGWQNQHRQRCKQCKRDQQSGDVFIRNRIKHMVGTNNSLAFQIQFKMETWHEVKQHNSAPFSHPLHIAMHVPKPKMLVVSTLQPPWKPCLWIGEHHPMSMLEHRKNMKPATRSSLAMYPLYPLRGCFAM